MPPVLRILVAVFVGFLVGIFVASCHFLLVEGSYQLSEWTGLEAAGEFSEKVGWPASHFYEQAQVQVLRTGLTGVSSGEESTPEQKAQARELESQLSEPANWSDENLDAAFDLLEEMDLETAVSLNQEYWIYGGVSLAWGVLCGVLGGALFFVISSWRARRRQMRQAIERSTSPIN